MHSPGSKSSVLLHSWEAEGGRGPRRVRLLHFLASCFWWPLQGQKTALPIFSMSKRSEKQSSAPGKTLAPRVPSAPHSLVGEECPSHELTRSHGAFRTTLFSPTGFVACPGRSALPLRCVLWGLAFSLCHQ